MDFISNIKDKKIRVGGIAWVTEIWENPSKLAIIG